MSMPAPWRHGYEWASNKGPHARKDSFDACEAYGYDFDTAEFRQFGDGADAFFNDYAREQGHDV